MRGLFGRNRNRSPRCVGLACDEDRFGLARVESGGASCHAPLDADELEQTVRQLHLRRQPAHLVLDVGTFRLLPAERPDVPEVDQVEALRWQIADLVEFDVTSAVIDCCPMGDESGHRGQSLVFVAVAPADVVRRGIHAVRAAGLRVASVGVPEFALRNLAARLPEAETGVVLLYARAQSAMILLVRGASLFVARRVEIAIDDEGGSNLDTLLLEIQRALDYYDGHFAHPPIRSLAIMGDQPVEDEAIRHLASQLRMEARWVPLEAFGEGLPAGGAGCARALGAALGPPAGPASSGKASGGETGKPQP